MSQTEQLVIAVTEAVLRHFQQSGANSQARAKSLPVGVSNRHVHVAAEDVQRLFGPGSVLTKQKDLSQPGQFACNETVTLVGSGGVIEKVRVLGPVRQQTQVEISTADGYRLGLRPPVRDSGDLTGSPGVTLVGPVGSVTLPTGVIVAARHVHMNPTDAAVFGVSDKERIDIRTSGPRGLIFQEVLVRVHTDFQLEMHLDLDEANAAGLNNQDHVTIMK